MSQSNGSFKLRALVDVTITTSALSRPQHRGGCISTWPGVQPSYTGTTTQGRWACGQMGIGVARTCGCCPCGGVTQPGAGGSGCDDLHLSGPNCLVCLKGAWTTGLLQPTCPWAAPAWQPVGPASKPCVEINHLNCVNYCAPAVGQGPGHTGSTETEGVGRSPLSVGVVAV